MDKKSSRISAIHREKGNAAYKKSDFLSSLIFYNKAIAYAPNNSEDLALAYANRSSVYLELKKYDECLKNIRLARKTGYPAEKTKTLNAREKKAKEMRLKDEEKSENDPWNFFKLSYKANDKIPFIIEHLEVRETKQYGRGIYTKEKLNPGDIISIEKPLLSTVYKSNDAPYKHCCNCMKSCMLNLFPCTKTVAVMFCSEICRDKTHERVFDPSRMAVENQSLNDLRLIAFGMDIFGTKDKFQTSVDNYKIISGNKTVFDYNLSNPKGKSYKKDLFSCILSLNYSESNFRWYKDAPNYSRGLLNFINHLTGICDVNLFSMQYLDATILGLNPPPMTSHGSGLFAFSSLFNHSCSPNVQRFEVDNKMVFIVMKPIEAGEQLFVNYVVDFYNNPNVAERRGKLIKYNFVCDCDACEYAYCVTKLLRPIYDVPSPFLRPSPKTVAESIKEIKENFKFIEDHGYNIMSHYNYDRIQRNHDLIMYVAHHAAFPC